MFKITDKHNIYQSIINTIPGISAIMDEPMRNHTSFRIGGNAEIFVSPSSEGEVTALIAHLKSESIPYTVIGNGSNLLVADSGISGVVICIGKNFSDIDVDGDTVYAQAGALLSKIAARALDNELAGFEFAAGIPGSLGGAVTMNAGAYGGEMKDVVVSTRYIASDGQIKECSGDEHCFGYRRSRFCSDEIILSSVIKLSRGNRDSIKEEMRILAEKRRDKQPLEYPSAGSTFKRPEGYFAAKLIDDAGLRGFRIGNAAVSSKHCGFVVNLGDATFADVTAVMKHVRSVVNEKFGVELEPEVRILGADCKEVLQ